MSVLYLLEIACSAGVTVSIVYDRIRVSGPKRAVNEVLPGLRRHERELRLVLGIKARRPCGVAPIPGSVSALELKQALGWDVVRFTRLCHEIVGRPGPSSVVEDHLICDVMLAQNTETGS